METNARYVLVGAAAVALIVLTSVGLLWLRKNARDDDLNFFSIEFRQQSLSGLREGSAVTMRGMAVGSLRRLKFEPGDATRVHALIGVSKSTPVRSDSEATVQRSLVTGLSTIDLSAGSNDAPLINSYLREEREYPKLKERPNQFDSMKDAAPELLHQSSETLRHIKELLSTENREQVTQILKNVEIITAKLASPDRGIERTLADIRDASNELKAVSSDARGMVTSFSSSVTKINSVFERLTGIVTDSVRSVSERITDMARGVQEATSKLGDPRKVLSGPAIGELGPGEKEKR